MRNSVPLSRRVLCSLAVVVSCVATPATVHSAPITSAHHPVTGADTKTSATPKKSVKTAAAHHRRGTLVAKGHRHHARAKEKRHAPAVAIVDATPLRFAPRVEEKVAPHVVEKVAPRVVETVAPHVEKAGPRVVETVAPHVEEKVAPHGAKVAPLAAIKGKKSARKIAKVAPKPPCLREAVHFERFEEKHAFSLLTCEGAPAPMAIEHLSLMARPGGVPLPAESVEALVKQKGTMLAQGLKRLDLGLLERLQSVVDKLRPKGTASLSVVSGYRPASKGSLHAEGQALDFSLAGATNVELVDACKTIEDTGCGFYPNSSFIHLDVRPKGAGHVSWIDASGPGEESRYMASWPPSPNDARRAKAAQGGEGAERQGREWRELPVDERRGIPASTSAPLRSPEEPSDR